MPGAWRSSPYCRYHGPRFEAEDPRSCDETNTLSHYRDKDQDEVDIVIENETAGLVGIEVKAAATVKAGDFKGLRKLADATGDRLRLGLVLYDGE